MGAFDDQHIVFLQFFCEEPSLSWSFASSCQMLATTRALSLTWTLNWSILQGYWSHNLLCRFRWICFLTTPCHDVHPCTPSQEDFEHTTLSNGVHASFCCMCMMLAISSHHKLYLWTSFWNYALGVAYIPYAPLQGIQFPLHSLNPCKHLCV